MPQKNILKLKFLKRNDNISPQFRFQFFFCFIVDKIIAEKIFK
jgi:hypothetical protein